MTILLTGATGFIGGAFLRVALAKGHQVVCLSRRPGEPPGELMPEGPRWVRGDLVGAPWKEIERFKPTVCVHSAWITTPGVYLESPLNESFKEWSVDFLKRAMDIGVNYTLALGSCAEYAATSQPCDEEHTPVEPASHYARCKDLVRQALDLETKRRGLKLAWGRVFYPYGEGESPQRLFSWVAQKLSRDEIVEPRTPKSVKDYIHVEDIALAMLEIVEAEFSGVINIGTGIGVPVQEIVNIIARAMKKEACVRETTSPAAGDFTVADIRRLRSLGWQPQITLEEGARRLVKETLKSKT